MHNNPHNTPTQPTSQEWGALRWCARLVEGRVGGIEGERGASEDEGDPGSAGGVEAPIT